MRIGLLTEGGYPYVSGDARLWCDRLVRGLGQHEFDIYALSRSEQQEDEGWIELPPQVSRVRTAPLWTAEDDGVGYGRRARRRFAECYEELAAAVCAGDAPVGSAAFEGSAGAVGAIGSVGSARSAGSAVAAGSTGAAGTAGGGGAAGGASAGASAAVADRFGNALYGLAELARDEGGLVGALRSETAVRALERACRAPGALRAARGARVPDLLTVAAQVERTLRPLSLDWYEDDGLGSVDLCHATSGGAAALPGLLARHFAGVPLLVTEYGVQLRAHYLGAREDLEGRAASSSARALLAAFHGRLAAEAYRQAEIITPGNTHARRWQERCGADRARIRTVYPGMEASRFSDVGESAEAADADTLVWVGRIEPAKDLISLLHAFAEIRKDEPKTRLRIVGAPAEGLEGATYLAHCKALAAQLFPDEADGVHTVGDNPVSFEEIGGPEVPTLPEAYEAGAVVVLSSVVEGFPISLVEAMFCGRATVSTDVGAVLRGGHRRYGSRGAAAQSTGARRSVRLPAARPGASCAPRRGGTRAGARTVHRRAEHHGISRHLPGDHRALSGPAGPRRRLGRTPAVRHTGRDPCTGAVGRLRHPTGRGQTRAGMGRGTTGPGRPARVRL
ncbi:DUF3492 domain-containing protein [Streptomyces sp. GLT-R25]